MIAELSEGSGNGVALTVEAPTRPARKSEAIMVDSTSEVYVADSEGFQELNLS